MSEQKNQEYKYCLECRRNVKISLHNNNGECPCLNCAEQKCKGLICNEFPTNRSIPMIDYVKGINSTCIKCHGQR